MARQIGQFFLVLGLITMVIFLATLQARQPSLPLCGTCSIFLILATVLLYNSRPATPAAARQGLFKRSKKKKE